VIRDIDGSQKEFTVVLNDTRPIDSYEVRLLSTDDEVHVAYNCSQGGVLVGLIGEDQWEKLPAEARQSVDELKARSDDSFRIDMKIVTTTERSLLTQKGSIVFSETTRTANLPVSTDFHGEEKILHLKHPAFIKIYLERLYLAKQMHGYLACTIDYQIWSYPNVNKFGFEIASGQILMAVGTILLALDGIERLWRGKDGRQDRSETRFH
jgi:hypothetical protein